MTAARPAAARQAAKAPTRQPGRQRQARGLAAGGADVPPSGAEVAVAEKPGPRAYFLIGENKKLAGDVAEHEWGWSKTKTGWTGAPQPVSGFLADLAAVKKEIGKGAPIALYEGYRWYAVIAPHLLHQLQKSGDVVLIPAPQPR